MFTHFRKRETFIALAQANWKSGLTVAFISVPLSIALAIASGAGPTVGLITGIWSTLIASIFGGSNYNIIGTAGALTTILFGATLLSPLGLGASVLPLIAILAGSIILCIWAIGADRLLYYIPSSVMYGFAAGVAFLIAASELFDATGLSMLKRTGAFLADIQLYLSHVQETNGAAVILFISALVFIFCWKRVIKSVPAVIPISVLGIVFGAIDAYFFPSIDLITLGDKFGVLTGSLSAPVPWSSIPSLVASPEAFSFLLKTSGIIALIAVLETLISEKIADKLTRTQSSSRQELFGLALANIGSGVMGGLPATGVFIRTGANIKAGATHKMSATIASIATIVISLLALPFFAFMPMVIVAAILVNTAIGLIDTEKFQEFWHQDKSSFGIAVLVAVVTIFEDAGIGVLSGALLALLFFADRVSHGRFDIILNFADNSKAESRGAKVLHVPEDKDIPFATYSIAGFLGYIDSGRHAANLRHLARAKNVHTVIVRLRDLFTLDFEGCEMLAEAVTELERNGKRVCITSANAHIVAQMSRMPQLDTLIKSGQYYTKTSEALLALRG